MTIFLQGNLEASCCLLDGMGHLFTGSQPAQHEETFEDRNRETRFSDRERRKCNCASGRGSAIEREGSLTVPKEAEALRPRFPLQLDYLKVKPFQKAQRHNFFFYFNTWSPNQFYEFSFSSSIQKILISKCTMTSVITVASYMENLVKE